MGGVGRTSLLSILIVQWSRLDQISHSTLKTPMSYMATISAATTDAATSPGLFASGTAARITWAVDAEKRMRVKTNLLTLFINSRIISRLSFVAAVLLKKS